MSRPGEKREVTIIGEEEVTTFPKIATPVVNVQITYVYGGLPPATVTIPKDEDTPQARAKMIREDIDQRMKRKIKTIEV